MKWKFGKAKIYIFSINSFQAYQECLETETRECTDPDLTLLKTSLMYLVKGYHANRHCLNVDLIFDEADSVEGQFVKSLYLSLLGLEESVVKITWKNNAHPPPPPHFLGTLFCTATVLVVYVYWISKRIRIWTIHQ